MELLRFFTAGNVDDGKSTLIGRLLFDSDSISTDIIETLTRQSKTTAADTTIDLALLTDGLRAEREQGITIDVAYKYFTTSKRKFIIADTPGHAQYTRNMFTGASTADLAIILIDARHGVTDQTKRHSIICGLLGIPEVVVCINKMDLVDYSKSVFDCIVNEYTAFIQGTAIKHAAFIPVSAFIGDNVVKRSERMDWYSGPALLELLETIQIESDNEKPGRFQVQYVIRPQGVDLHDYRGYAGTMLSGSFKTGETVKIFPSELTTQIVKIEKNQVEIEQSYAHEPVVIHLANNLDVSRGTSIASASESPCLTNEVSAIICWMDNKSALPGQKLLLQQHSFRTKAVLKKIEGKLDIHTGELVEDLNNVGLNEFARVWIKTADPVTYDPYATNRRTGAFILIHEQTNNTVAAGVIY